MSERSQSKRARRASMETRRRIGLIRSRSSQGIDRRYIPVIALIVLILIALIVLIGVLRDKFGTEKGSPREYASYISEASEDFSLPVGLILAVIRKESDFQPKVVSSAGARGLMQIMPTTLVDINRRMKTDYTENDLFDPAINIRCGCCYLNYLYDIFGDYDLVLAAYNGGIGNVQKWLQDDRYCQDGKLTNIPYPETAEYVKTVKAFWQKYNDFGA